MIGIVKIMMLSLLLLPAAAVCSTAAETSGAERLEIWQAMEMAEQNNPALKGSYIEKEKSDIDVKIAEGNEVSRDRPVGQYRFFGLSFHCGTDKGSWSLPSSGYAHHTFGVELKIPIYTGGKLEAEKISAQKTSAAASEDYRQRRQDLLLQCGFGLFKIAVFRDMKEASAKRIRALEDAEKSLELLLREGRIPKLDLLRLQTHLSQARHDHIVFDQAEKDSLSLLGTLTGNQYPVDAVAAMPLDVELGALDEIEKATFLTAAMR